MGYAKNYLVPVVAGLPEEEYAITTGADDIEIAAFQARGGAKKVIAWYIGSDAITIANYNALPTGTVLFDLQANKMYIKTGATAWKGQAPADITKAEIEAKLTGAITSHTHG
jgi:hypothetical protein